MGSFLSTTSNLNKDDKDCYRVKAKDAEAMKNLWKMIENNPSHYGSIFSTIFFRNHPQYVKYFHEGSIPEFVEDARIKKKFSTVCSIVSGLFINYMRKNHQRDHLLGYIAMIHKDMQLSSQDLENFMMDLLEMLTQERPKDMTTECRDLIMQYISVLLKRLEYFMEVQRKNDFCMMKRLVEPRKRNCGCESLCNPASIYGRSFEYWLAKKEYWQRRLAVWSSLQRDLSKKSSFTIAERDDRKVHRTETVKYNFSKRSSNLVARNKRDVLKMTSYPRAETTSSESTSNDIREDEEKPICRENVKISNSRRFSWYQRSKEDRRGYRRNSILSSKSKTMEAIPEVLSRILIDPATPPSRKCSTNKTQGFRNSVKTINNTKINSESEEIFSDNAVKRKTLIDTARARKRSRDKKLNAIQYTNKLNNVECNEYKCSSAIEVMLQFMDLGTLITSEAGKFAEVLAKRKTQ